MINSCNLPAFDILQLVMRNLLTDHEMLRGVLVNSHIRGKTQEDVI